LLALGTDYPYFVNSDRFVDALFTLFSLILDGQRKSPSLRIIL